MQKHIIVSTITGPRKSKTVGHHLGNGLTVAFQKDGRQIAHVSDTGDITWYVKNPGKGLVVEVENIAADHRNGVKRKDFAPLLLTAKALIEGTFWFFKGQPSTPKEADTNAILTLAETLYGRGFLTASFLNQLVIISGILPMTAYPNLDVSTFIQTKQ